MAPGPLPVLLEGMDEAFSGTVVSMAAGGGWGPPAKGPKVGPEPEPWLEPPATGELEVWAEALEGAVTGAEALGADGTRSVPATVAVFAADGLCGTTPGIAAGALGAD